MTKTEFYTSEGCFMTELSNTPDDAAVSIARARVLPGVTTRWHRVKGTAERYLIVEGTGRVDVENAPSRDVAAGDVVFIPPSWRQRISNTGAGNLVFLAICTPRFTAEAYEEIEC